MSRVKMAVPGPGISDSANSLPICKEKPWIELFFHKRECFKYIPSARDPTRCGCGRTLQAHCIPRDELSRLRSDEVWNVQDHTRELPTDAYGTIEFQGGAHPTKAQSANVSSYITPNYDIESTSQSIQYVRLSHTTSPSLILQLLQQTWDLELPKLLISIHGGIRNFELQPKLKRVFRKGLLKAAKTTGAWIISGGTNSGK
ncbi:hypothetical protein LSH36_300g03014 [Paralvinella palmiformis]|uniref:TRPM SLOG domain-containing protein n=1 Tax=Paralvinella palmiformis TaxID=53620 RepID=A0AAD9JII0_9ANNE|nr:hypothetical protein LSH36_300g03014 [Paralvinella palmiformis]